VAARWATFAPGAIARRRACTSRLRSGRNRRPCHGHRGRVGLPDGPHTLALAHRQILGKTTGRRGDRPGRPHLIEPDLQPLGRPLVSASSCCSRHAERCRIFGSLRGQAPSPHGVQISPYGGPSAPPRGSRRGGSRRGLGRDHERSGSHRGCPARSRSWALGRPDRRSASDKAAEVLAVCTGRVEREEVRHVTTTVSAPPGAD